MAISLRNATIRDFAYDADRISDSRSESERYVIASIRSSCISDATFGWGEVLVNQRLTCQIYSTTPNPNQTLKPIFTDALNPSFGASINLFRYIYRSTTLRLLCESFSHSSRSVACRSIYSGHKPSQKYYKREW